MFILAKKIVSKFLPLGTYFTIIFKWGALLTMKGAKQEVNVLQLFAK